MYYAILTHSERRRCLVTTGARTAEAAHVKAHQLTPRDWSGLDYTTQLTEATSRAAAIEASPEARTWASK